MIEVKTGIQNDDYIEIVNGLDEGVEVVAGPYATISRKLENGSKIEVVDEDDLYSSKKRS